MTTLILDGSNLCLWGQKSKRQIRTLGALLPCLRALLIANIPAYVIFDASFRYRIDKKSRAAAEFEALLMRDENFQMAPAGTQADDFILQFAALRGFGVVSSDTFSEHVTWKGKGKEKKAFFNGKPMQLHSFQMFMGGFVVPSLGISYLIEDSALDVEDIIAARGNHRSPSAPADPARPRKPAPKPAPPTQPPRPSRTPGDRKLDFMLELSPLFLRAHDVFDAHHRLNGTLWRPQGSDMGAEEFGRRCFDREALYVERPGRDREDGFYCDPQYAKAHHIAVRSWLMEEQPRMLPLIASGRGRLVDLIEMLRADGIASGFTFQQLRAHADKAGLSCYGRYLHSLLWALVAADGVEGEDPDQLDIATVLQGRMRAVPGATRSDMLNFLQRGILFLLANPDNSLPEMVRTHIGWMLQLPQKEHIQAAIIRGHLEWLADCEG